MDPTATWKLLLESWRIYDWDMVLEAAAALLDWIGRDGVPPETIPERRMGADWNRIVIQSVCRFAAELADDVLADPNGIPAGVPFTVSCYDCDAFGPSSFDEARDAGWSHIKFAPDGVAENFLGYCSEHSPQQE